MAEDLSPSDIRARKFSTVRRGFDRSEVADFLDVVGGRVDTLEGELSSISTRLNQLGITDLVDLKEEIEDVGLEIQSILDAAIAAAEGLRARAATAAADTLTEADQAAISLREDAWKAGTAALDDATSQASRTIAEAREDALFVRAQAEQDAKRLVTQARREADESLRSSREEGERIVVMARAESDSIVEEATRAAEKAQERARVLENRRTELLNELQEAESAIRDVEASRPEPEPDVDGGVRVIATGGDERTRWPEDDGAVRILPAVPPEPEEPEPVDAEAMAAEVEMMRSAVTMPQAVESEEETGPIEELPAEQPEEVREDAETEPVEPEADSVPELESLEPEAESAEPEAEPVEPEAGSMPELEPLPEPASEPESDDEKNTRVEDLSDLDARPLDEPEPEAVDGVGVDGVGVDGVGVDGVGVDGVGVDKTTVVKDDPGIDDLFARLRHSVEDPPAQPEAVPALEPVPDPEPQPVERPAAPPALHVVPDVDSSGDFDRRDRVLLPIENRGLRGLKRRVVELQNRVLEELRRSSGEWRLGREHVSETMGEELDSVLIDSYRAGHATAAEVLEKPEPQLIGGPERGAAETFTADLHRDVQSVIERGDPGSRRLAADVGRVFRNWRTDEAEKHVRVAARRAYNDGLLAGYERLGVEMIEVAGPGKPCGQCSAGTGLSWDPGDEPPPGVTIPPVGPKCAGLIVPIAPTGSDSRPGQ